MKTISDIKKALLINNIEVKVNLDIPLIDTILNQHIESKDEAKINIFELDMEIAGKSAL